MEDGGPELARKALAFRAFLFVWVEISAGCKKCWPQFQMSRLEVVNHD